MIIPVWITDARILGERWGKFAWIYGNEVIVGREYQLTFIGRKVTAAESATHETFATLHCVDCVAFLFGQRRYGHHIACANVGGKFQRNALSSISINRGITYDIRKMVQYLLKQNFRFFCREARPRCGVIKMRHDVCTHLLAHFDGDIGNRFRCNQIHFLSFSSF